MLDEEINEEEFLFRGIVVKNWDFINDRPSSSTFKDSFGVSVDRNAERTDDNCLSTLLQKKDFHAVCKIQKKHLDDLNALTLYKPVENNIYHCEIHDSAERIQIRGKKPKRIQEKSVVIFKKDN